MVCRVARPAEAESTDPHTDGKTFGIYAETMIPRFTDVDMELAVAAVNALPALLAVAEEMKTFWQAWDKARNALANLEKHG